MRPHQVVLAARELLDLPDEARLLRRVVDASSRRLVVHEHAKGVGSAWASVSHHLSSDAHPELWRVGVVRYGHVDLDVVSRASPFELRPDLDDVLDPRPPMVLNRRCEEGALGSISGRSYDRHLLSQ